MDCKRKGGSNGKKDNLELKKLFQAISRPGMSPRQAHGSMWILQNRSIVLIYMGCRSDEAKASGG